MENNIESTSDILESISILDSENSDNPIIKHLYDNFMKIFVIGEKNKDD
jgi:hypothetical protein